MARVKKTARKTYSKHTGFTVVSKVLKALIIVVMLGVFAAGIVSGSKILEIAKSAPEVDLEKFLSMTSQSVLLDDAGRQIDTVKTWEIRFPVKLEDVSQITKDAFVATEDERFYDHHGVDYKRTIVVTLRYLYGKLTGGNFDQGGSTLTQQLVKSIFLYTDKEEKRKIQEMYMALQIEKKVPKDKILETYLNSIFLGGRAYGIEAAARQYFGKSAKDLTLIEAAYLAGVPTSPSDLYAFSDENKANPEYYLNRTLVVLGQMLKNGYITQEQYDENSKIVREGRIPFKETPLVENDTYAYEFFTRPAVDQVVNDLAAKLSITPEEAQAKFATGGYKVYTTLNVEKQQKIQDMFNDPETFRFQEYVGPNGIIQPQAAAAVIEPSTGYVKVVVGGRGEEMVAGAANRATSYNFLRAVGSATKPLTIFAAGIDQRIFDAASVFEDSPLTREQRLDYFDGDETAAEDPTIPGNAYGSWKGYINARDALRVSSNLVAIKGVMSIGMPVAEDYAQRFGLVLPPEEYRGLSMYALGQYPSVNGEDGGNPMIMASAFGTFANGGVRQRPVFYSKVVDGTGRVILENTPENNGTQIIQPGTAYIMWDILKDVAKENQDLLFSDKFPIAGKTGTTEENKEVWFSGTTPYYSCAVMVGADDHQTLIDRETGDRLSSRMGTIPVWSKIMEEMHKGLEPREIPIPNDIVKVAVSHDSGTLPTDLTRMDPRGDRTIEEWFFTDRIPTTFDTVHVAVSMNRSTGQVAGINTPQSLKSSKIYITRFYEPEVTLEDQQYVLPKSLWEYVMDMQGNPRATEIYTAPPPEPEYVPQPEYVTETPQTTQAQTTQPHDTQPGETVPGPENPDGNNQGGGIIEPVQTTTQQ